MMASIAEPASQEGKGYAGPDRTERLLGWGALFMLAAIIAALLRGRAHWGEMPWPVWGHLGTIGLALALTPAILWRRRGDGRHRKLGYVWVGAMALTALISLQIRMIGRGHLSIIHLLSIYTLIQLPIAVLAARSGNHARHRSGLRGMVIGALLIAGFFTFPFDRLLGRWLFGG